MKYVLFVCNHNAGRSQIAQAFFDRDAPADVRAESAGSTPARAIWPEVVEVMAEAGLDLSKRKPKRLGLEMQLHADWAVTMACGDACPYVPSAVEDWDVPDPHGLPIDQVREVRDIVEERVHEFIENRLDLVRADRTAHEQRLASLLPGLIEEFGAEHPAAEIRGCADQVLDRLADARVRSHILTFANRQARECLRQNECAPVA